MENIAEILKYTIPALIVFLTAYLLISKMLNNFDKIRNAELIMENQKITTSLKLQAYERLVLLLERLSPDALIMRISKNNMTSKQLHTSLLSAIRSEFDHNLSQQIYISAKAWSVIKGAKENLIKLINNAAEKVEPDKPSVLLSKAIIERLMEIDKPPTQIAIDYLKEELQVFI
ncbi:MAG: hypothetical protein GXO79_00640 [Chlorobi bacterium]|nr:hypothetical protein [Chlorobiota bacterium]